MRPRTLLLAVTLSMATPATALAQPADTHALAEDQFRQGRELMKKQDYKRALELLLQSQGLEAGRGKLLNIGICEEELGLLVSAMRHFQELLPQLPDTDERVEFVKQRIAAISPRVALLRIEVGRDSPAGATMTLDGVPVTIASLAVDIPIASGPHVIVVKASGWSDKRFEFVLRERDRRTVTVAPEQAAAAPMPTQVVALPPVALPVEPARSGGVSPLVVGGFAVGGAGFIVAAITGGLSLSKTAPLKTCFAKHDCGTTYASDVASANTLANISNVTIGLGIAGAAVGIVGLVLSTRRAPAPAVSAHVEPVVGPRALGLRGTF